MPELQPTRDGEQLEWVELSDFTLGIHAGYFGGDGQPVKDGALQDDTYGCVGPATGGLAPGPRLVASYLSAGGLDAANRSMIVGMQVVSPADDIETLTGGGGWF